MNEVKLKPFPENEPEHEASYLCQIGHNFFDILHWKKGIWLERDWMPFDDLVETVTAFSDLPDPIKVDAKKVK